MRARHVARQCGRFGPPASLGSAVSSPQVSAHLSVIVRTMKLGTPPRTWVRALGWQLVLLLTMLAAGCASIGSQDSERPWNDPPEWDVGRDWMFQPGAPNTF
jgi:hypothetical protein